MDVPSAQFACGVLAVSIPLLLIAGYYSQLLLDKLGERRDQLALTLISAVAVVGEAAALIGLVRPNRALEAIAALGGAISGTGVLLVVGYLVRLRAQHRALDKRRRPHP